MTYSANFEEKVLWALWRLESDVSELKTDVSVLKTDVAGLKTDIAGLKTDIAGLKTDVWVLQHKVDELDNRTFAMNMKLDRVDRKIDDNTEELKQEIRLQGKYLNQAFGYIEDARTHKIIAYKKTEV